MLQMGSTATHPFSFTERMLVPHTKLPGYTTELNVKDYPATTRGTSAWKGKSRMKYNLQWNPWFPLAFLLLVLLLLLPHLPQLLPCKLVLLLFCSIFSCTLFQQLTLFVSSDPMDGRTDEGTGIVLRWLPAIWRNWKEDTIRFLHPFKKVSRRQDVRWQSSQWIVTREK